MDYSNLHPYILVYAHANELDPQVLVDSYGKHDGCRHKAYFCFILTQIHGMNPYQISRKIGYPRGTVRRRLKVAHKLLDSRRRQAEYSKAKSRYEDAVLSLFSHVILQQ